MDGNIIKQLGFVYLDEDATDCQEGLEQSKTEDSASNGKEEESSELKAKKLYTDPARLLKIGLIFLFASVCICGWCIHCYIEFIESKSTKKNKVEKFDPTEEAGTKETHF